MDQMPVFVKVEEYDDVLSLIKIIRHKLNDAKSTLVKVHELKNEEDHQVEMWQNSLGEIEKKIDFLDHSLGNPERY